MKSRILLTSSAFIYLLGGLALLFAPGPIAERLWGLSPALTWVVQMLGGAWCGFATLNWLSRGMVVGGIYGRPLVATNLVHALIATLVLAKAGMRGSLPQELWSIALGFVLLTVAYGVKMYGSPTEEEMGGGSGK